MVMVLNWIYHCNIFGWFHGEKKVSFFIYAVSSHPINNFLKKLYKKLGHGKLQQKKSFRILSMKPARKFILFLKVFMLFQGCKIYGHPQDIIINISIYQSAFPSLLIMLYTKSPKQCLFWSLFKLLLLLGPFFLH